MTEINKTMTRERLRSLRLITSFIYHLVLCVIILSCKNQETSPFGQESFPFDNVALSLNKKKFEMVYVSGWRERVRIKLDGNSAEFEIELCEKSNPHLAMPGAFLDQFTLNDKESERVVDSILSLINRCLFIEDVDSIPLGESAGYFIINGHPTWHYIPDKPDAFNYLANLIIVLLNIIETKGAAELGTLTRGISFSWN